VCAVERRRFPVGVNPTRQLLQPEGAFQKAEMEKWWPLIKEFGIKVE
jgi:hypothetical protein